MVDRAMIIDKRNKDFDDNYEDFCTMMDEIRDTASWNASFMRHNDEDTLEE